MFTKEEKDKIEELRKRVRDELINEEQREDFYLIRWLRARSMNVDKAEEMLRKSLAWRKKTGADTILEKEDFPEEYKKKFMFAVFGEDTDGCPILMLPAGRHNHRMLLEAEGMDACLRWNIVWMEKIMNIVREARKKSGKPVYSYHEILDMEGYSYKSFMYKPAVQYILETQKMFDENYPDILKSVMVINAPRIFSLLYSLIKPLAAKETIEKVTVYGCNEESWKKAFAENFPLDKFPPRWGGILEGSDEFCSQESVWIEGPIPLQYFKEVPQEDDDGFFTVKVNARDRLMLEYSITKSNTRVDWKFKTENHDVAFKISFTTNGSSNKEIIKESKRVDSHTTLQEGSSTFSSPGTCTFCFDNRYSYTKSKVLKYQINVSESE